MKLFFKHLKNYRNNIFFVGYLLTNPKYFKYLVKGINIPNLIHFNWLDKFNIGTVIDVGSYRGSLIEVSQLLIPKAKIFAFEPIPESFTYIKKKYAKHKNIIVENVAIGNKRKPITFYKNSYLPGSSSLKVQAKLLNKYNIEQMKKYSRITLREETLDNYFSKIKLAKNVMLKIDTQGTEYYVLKGARKLLEKTAVVHIEAWYYDEVYKKQILFDSIYRLLTKAGFIYCGDIRESEFYPAFSLHHRENSVFINPKYLVL
jgi:FkbM family methyltransferase